MQFTQKERMSGTFQREENEKIRLQDMHPLAQQLNTEVRRPEIPLCKDGQ